MSVNSREFFSSLLGTRDGKTVLVPNAVGGLI
jgi:hypothetical protein